MNVFEEADASLTGLQQLQMSTPERKCIGSPE